MGKEVVVVVLEMLVSLKAVVLTVNDGSIKLTQSSALVAGSTHESLASLVRSAV